MTERSGWAGTIRVRSVYSYTSIGRQA